MSENNKIEPKNFVVTDTVTSFEVRCNNYTMYKSASFLIIMYREDESVYKTDMMNLTTEEFNGWAENDNYIRDLVAFKYGFVLK